MSGARNPVSVLCPTCLAKPGNPCRSIVSWMRGIEHGQGSVCKPHNTRRVKASGLRVIETGGGR